MQRSHIPRERLQQMFDNIRSQTKWNIDGEMLWGYFFFDGHLDRLRVAQADLQAEGYRFVGTHQVEEGTSKGMFVLHVEKIESHTVDSLDRRNGELAALAKRLGLAGYDGMDVGPVTAG